MVPHERFNNHTGFTGVWRILIHREIERVASEQISQGSLRIRSGQRERCVNAWDRGRA